MATYQEKGSSPIPSDEEKKIHGTSGGYDVGVYAAHGDNQGGAYENSYDPSKESLMTRLGLNFESFKRAPGTTRGLVAHGDIPPEFIQHDNPLLQQKMKPRHLQMIAVGT
jgi:amino acid transporter